MALKKPTLKNMVKWRVGRKIKVEGKAKAEEGRGHSGNYAADGKLLEPEASGCSEGRGE